MLKYNYKIRNKSGTKVPIYTYLYKASRFIKRTRLPGYLVYCSHIYVWEHIFNTLATELEQWCCTYNILILSCYNTITMNTVGPRRLDPFFIVTYIIKWVKTFWTNSKTSPTRSFDFFYYC